MLAIRIAISNSTITKIDAGDVTHISIADHAEMLDLHYAQHPPQKNVPTQD
jgi:hypothetical protein